MKKGSSIFILAAFATAFLLSTNPVLAVEDGVSNGALQAIREQFLELQKEFQVLRQAAPGDRSAFERFLSKLSFITNSLAELKKSVHETRALSRGSGGEDVKALQEQLKEFKDIYPEGLVTGHFGPVTEKAVKKLQEVLGLEQVGVVGPKTRDKLGQLDAAKGRKERPKITSISPDEISVGAVITVSGRGFTFEGNHLFVRGRLVLKDISSPDGGTLEFAIPPTISCAVGIACPIKIVNENGISNAKPFKLVEPTFVEPPIEPQIPPPPPPPPPQPQITSINPSYGLLGTAVTLSGTGFNAANNSVNFGGLSNALTGLASSDGITLKFNVPSTPCKVLDACQVLVTNAGGTSNFVSFTLSQPVTPVVISSPNGGEKWTLGTNNTISWTGGTDAVQIALVEPTAEKGSDPTPLIVGWINTGVIASQPNSSMAWSTSVVCDTSGTVCAPIDPGDYKILAISENELGQVVIGFDASGNWDVSDQPFTVVPAPKITVLSPNGGDKWIIGDTVTVTWDMVNVQNKHVQILLYDQALQKSVAPIVQDFPVSADTGTFIYNWVVPSSIPAGSNYTVWVQEYEFVWGKARDWSDSTFTIALKSAISVTAPNGGETWFSGFKGLVRWNSANILSKSVNINLLKGGVFYRSLGTNVLQKFYSWQTEGYTSGTGFNTYVDIPSDVPPGSDYTLEIMHSSDPSVRDVSDAPFTIMPTPEPMTFFGRMINRFTQAVLPNQYIYNHAYFGSNVPQWSSTAGKTDAEGKFSVSTTTRDGFWRKIPVGGWPTCYMNWAEFVDAPPITPPTHISWWRHIFDLQKDASSILNKSSNDLGDVLMWPAKGIYTYTDNPLLIGPQVNYPDSGYGGYQILALETDLQVSYYDYAKPGFVSSPPVRFSLASGCTPATLTYLGGQFKWEPYNIRGSATVGSPSTFSVGTPVSIKFYASGGTAPYKWGLYYGTLPLGLSQDPSTGVISGTPTTAGTYKYLVKITDANGVNGGLWPMTIVIK